MDVGHINLIGGLVTRLKIAIAQLCNELQSAVLLCYS